MANIPSISRPKADPCLPLLFVLGDSISIQYGPFLSRNLRETARYECKSGMAMALKDLDDPQGANGGDSSMVLAYLRERLALGNFSPDILLVNCGLHDIKSDPITKERQVSLDQYRVNLREIFQLFQGTPTRTVWVRTTHSVDEIHNGPANPGFLRFSKDGTDYNEAADAIVQEMNVPFIDLAGFTRSLGESQELFCDHVHFHEAICQQQAAFIAGWMTRFLETR